MCAMTGINSGDGDDCSDEIDDAVQVIDTEHRRVHLGFGFRCAKLYSVTAGATVNLEIKTGSKFVHLKQSGLVADINVILSTVIESPVITDGTTPVPVLNTNRTSSNASTVKVFSDPTSVSGGTTIDTELVAAAKSNVQIPSAIEWLLKPNTTYVVQITNQGGTTSQVLARYFWYEMVGNTP